MAGNVYEVDKILADKLVDGVKQYKIHWAGYSSDHDSWEPDTSLIGCSSIIHDYNSTKDTTVLPDPLDSPRRFRRRNPSPSRHTPGVSPSRYNLRRTPQRLSYLTADGTDSPLGDGYERRSLREEVDAGPQVETTHPATPATQGDDTSVTTKPPSWMELGYAELLLCLSILVIIAVSVWYLSNVKVANPFP